MARSRSLAVATAVAVAAATVWLPAAPAFAHTKLTGSTPKAEATVTKLTTTVTLKFSGLIKTAGTTVVVAGPDKASYSDGAATAVDRTITQPVRPLPVGHHGALADGLLRRPPHPGQFHVHQPRRAAGHPEPDPDRRSDVRGARQRR